MAGAPRPATSAAAQGAGASGADGRRLAIAGIALVFIAVVAGAALFLSGALNPGTPINPTPLTAAATDALSTDTPAPATDASTPEPTAEPTPRSTPNKTVPPEPTPAATRTPRPTKGPTPSPPTPSQAPPPTAYVCGTDTTIADPLNAGWNIRRIDWRNMGKFDRLIVTLDQKGTGGNGTQAIVHVLPPAEVSTTLKVGAPQAGDVAVALGLFQDVRLTWTLDRALTLPSLKWITMEKDDNGFPWIVLGAKGTGCYSLQVPDWTPGDPRPASTILVTIDVQH